MPINHRLPILARLGAVVSLTLFVVTTMLALFGLRATTTNASANMPAPAPVALSTTVLDTFNRANGGVGSNWRALTSTSFYKIASNRLDVQLGGLLVWKTVFGTTQDAFLTLQTIDKQSPSQGLLLKVQPGSLPDGGAIAVVYDALAKAVRVSTLRVSAKSWTAYPRWAATFANGDRLGARALSSGTVEIYKNGALLGTSIVGNAVVDPSCSGNITINVSVQAVQPVSDPPTGTFYLECIGGACPSGTSAVLGYPATASVVAGGVASAWMSSASFTIPVGAVSAPAPLHIRIVFVPHLASTVLYLFSIPSPYRASQIGYDITVPGSPSCPQVSLSPPTVSVDTYVEATKTYIDTGCPNDVEFPAVAYTVPVSAPPAGTFIFECAGDFCPVEFFVPELHVIHAVSSPSPSFTVPILEFTPADYFFEVTFIPDDPNQLPTRTSNLTKVGNSQGCPIDIPIITNGPPPTP